MFLADIDKEIQASSKKPSRFTENIISWSHGNLSNLRFILQTEIFIV